jgi:hypothetical protein
MKATIVETVTKLRCAYCLHESEPGDEVRLYDRVRWKKKIALCESSEKCLERQLASRNLPASYGEKLRG